MLVLVFTTIFRLLMRLTGFLEQNLTLVCKLTKCILMSTTSLLIVMDSAYASPLTYPAYTFYPCAYLFTTKDAATPLKVRERMVYAAGIKETAKVDAGHSPHISRPAFVEKFIRKCAGEPLSEL